MNSDGDNSSLDLFDKVIMNVCGNLRTLSVNLLIQTELDSNQTSLGADSWFKAENDLRIEKELQYKRDIFKMYKDVFNRSPELFK
jgi:hypothetical protein